MLPYLKQKSRTHRVFAAISCYNNITALFPWRDATYCQKDLFVSSCSSPNNKIQALKLLQRSQIYKIQHLDILTASTNICETLGTQQIPVRYLVDAPLSNKFSWNISSHPHMSHWTKWKLLRTTPTQPWSSEPHKIPDRRWGPLCTEHPISSLHVVFRLA